MIRCVKLNEVIAGAKFYMVTTGVSRLVTIISKPIKLSLGHRVTYSTVIGKGEVYENHFYLEEYGVSSKGTFVYDDQVNGLFFTEVDANAFIEQTRDNVKRHLRRMGDTVSSGDFSITLKG